MEIFWIFFLAKRVGTLK